MPKKGPEWEREFCRLLTAWWTGDPDADVCFWRTSQSGGRATVRRKNKKKTHRAHCGDVAALDDVGKPLTDLITFELKRGYSKYTVQDLLDRPEGAALQEWEKWVIQAQDAARNAGTPHWMIVVRRNQKAPIVCFRQRLLQTMIFHGVNAGVTEGFPYLTGPVGVDGCATSLVFMTLAGWFALVQPETIHRMRKAG